ncbi:MAG: MFS transporter [Acidimicrobiales bacterium]
MTATSALPASLTATMAVQMRSSLQFGAAALGLAISIFYLGAAASSVPASRLAEAVGGARVMRVVAVCAGALLLLLGTQARSWTVLAVLLAGAGMVSGAVAPATNLFLARRRPADHQGLAFGIKQSAVPLASLLGGLAVPTIALSVGWQWAFRIGALVALLASLSVPASRTSIRERQRLRREAARPPLRTLPLVVVATGFCLGMLAASGCTAFVVSGAVATGYPKGMAGVLAAVASVAAMTARIGAGERADRRGGRHFVAVVSMMVVGVLGFVLLAVGAGLESEVLFGLGAVVALGAGWGWNGLLTYAVVRSHPESPAAATGITQVGARLGGVLGPLLVGVVVAGGSYTIAWVLTAAAALGAAATVLLGHRLLRRPAGPSPAPAALHGQPLTGNP